MNQGELIRELAERAEITRGQAERVLKALFDARHGMGVLADALDRGERVSIAGFGTFSLHRRASREIPDPATGGRRRIAPARVPRFKPSSRLRERLD
jgi:DNA-binding protein HU-beta